MTSGRHFDDPVRCDKRSGTVRPAHLDETAHAHRLTVLHLLRGLFAKFRSGFSADTEIRPGQWRKNAVPGAIGEVGRVDGMPLLGRGLPSGHADDVLPVHGALAYGTVQKQRNVRLVFHGFIENAVPDRVELVGIAIQGFQRDLLNDTRFAIVFAVRAADPHPDLRRRIAAKHRTIPDQNDPGTASCRRDRRAAYRQVTANDTEIRRDEFS